MSARSKGTATGVRHTVHTRGRAIRLHWDGATVSFKARPAGSLCFTVRIFSTRKAMRTFHRKGNDHEFPPVGRHGRACCHTFTKVTVQKGGQRVEAEIGELHFTRDGLTMRIVTHECVHAGLGWARRKHLDLAAGTTEGTGKHMARDCPEEQLCYAVGEIATQIVAVGDALGWC